MANKTVEELRNSRQVPAGRRFKTGRFGSPIPRGLVDVGEVLQYLETDRYFDKGEAAAYLSLSVRNLQGRLGEIPHFRVGAKILFKRSELNQWMRQWQKRDSSLDEAMKIVDQMLESEGEA